MANVKSSNLTEKSVLAILMRTKVKKADADNGSEAYKREVKQDKLLEAVFYSQDEASNYVCHIFPLIEQYAKREIKLPSNQSFDISIGYYPVTDFEQGYWQLNILTAPIITHNKINYGIFDYDKAPLTIQEFFTKLWEFSEKNDASDPLTEEKAMGVYNLGNRHP